MQSRYYDKDGKPLELMEWAKLFENADYKRVASTTLPDGTWVSTVWVGLNQSFSAGPPLIFETMVFPKKGHVDEEEMARYSTLEEALAGHTAMVKKWKGDNSDALPKV